jgi:LysM repeat protein
MKLGQGDWNSRLGQSRLTRGLGPVLSGLLATVLVALTLFVAVALGVQEQTLVAGIQPSATVANALPSPTTPSATIPPTAVPKSPTPQPAASVTPSLTPEPSSTPTEESTAEPATPCEIPSGWQLYVVQRGDSFRSIAVKFGTSEYRLKQGNCLQATASAYAGQRIYVPKPSLPCTKPSGWVSYTIQRGDTLSSIAARYGISVDALKQANCRTANTIYAGETLWVPFYLPPTSTPKPKPTSTRAPTRTPTTAPTTGTPGSSATPTATASETPGSSATPTSTLEPTTGTAEPDTATPGPTSGAPTDTAEPTDTTTPPTATTEPTATSAPPTETSAPPTNTPPPPTNTPVPPTNTPVPPTNTPVPPTATETS